MSSAKKTLPRNFEAFFVGAEIGENLFQRHIPADDSPAQPVNPAIDHEIVHHIVIFDEMAIAANPAAVIPQANLAFIVVAGNPFKISSACVGVPEDRPVQRTHIFDAEDNLRHAKKTYRGMFLGDYDGPFTFTDIIRHAHSIGLGVRIDDNDVEALLARTLPRRRSVLRKSFETDLVDDRYFRAGRSGSEAKPCGRGEVINARCEVRSIKCWD